MGGLAIWITGLPGSGKSAVSDAVLARRPGMVLLRMDELRKFVTPSPTYSEQERDMVYRCIIYIAQKMTETGRDVLIDATGHRRQWRELARRTVPAFVEIHLTCAPEECMRREKDREISRGAPRHIYEKGAAGWPVPGLTVPYEAPESPEIMIDTGKVPVEEAADIIDNFLDQKTI